MENNENNYQVLNNNPQTNAYPQPGYANNMQPYNAGQPSITYHVTNQPLTENNLPEEFKPISPWGYLGYNLLFSIPLIGLIMLCVYAFGGTSKVNLRNYAQSYFCILLIAIVIVVFLSITGAFSSLSSVRR